MEMKITINDKLINFLKKVFSKKNGVFIIAAVLFCGGLLLFSQQVELDTFHDGDIIYAGPINDNFRALRDRELGSLADVDTSGADVDKVLKYNGENWYAGNDDGGTNGDCEWDTVPGGINYAGGNVGIGTTIPGAKLHIRSINDYANILLETTSTTYVNTLNNRASTVNNYFNTFPESYSPTQSRYKPSSSMIETDGTNGLAFATINSAPIDFYTNGNNHRMTIDNTGNVGIGTTTPNSKLAVTGLPEYTDNADAIANGLAAGDFYRTGDLLKVVH